MREQRCRTCGARRILDAHRDCRRCAFERVKLALAYETLWKQRHWTDECPDGHRYTADTLRLEIRVRYRPRRRCYAADLVQRCRLCDNARARLARRLDRARRPPKQVAA